MPDVALGSETSLSGSVAATSSLAQAASASMSAALSKENEELRKQLREAIASYEAETRRTYSGSRSTSQTSSSSTSDTLNLQAAYKLAVTVSELSGRSQQVLLAREFLYRLCEARANRFFVDDQVFADLQNNALKMIESISVAQKASDLALRSEELKQVIAYNEQQTKLCELKLKTCTDEAGADAGKKAGCAKSNAECVASLKPIAPSDVAKPKSESALKDPKVNKTSTFQ